MAAAKPFLSVSEASELETSEGEPLSSHDVIYKP